MEHEPQSDYDPIEHVGTFANVEELVASLPESERNEIGLGMQLDGADDYDAYVRAWADDKFIIRDVRGYIDVYRVK